MLQAPTHPPYLPPRNRRPHLHPSTTRYCADVGRDCQQLLGWHVQCSPLPANEGSPLSHKRLFLAVLFAEQAKPTTDFYANRRKKDGLQPSCKACLQQKNQAKKCQRKVSGPSRSLARHATNAERSLAHRNPPIHVQGAGRA